MIKSYRKFKLETYTSKNKTDFFDHFRIFRIRLNEQHS